MSDKIQQPSDRDKAIMRDLLATLPLMPLCGEPKHAGLEELRAENAKLKEIIRILLDDSVYEGPEYAALMAARHCRGDGRDDLAALLIDIGGVNEEEWG